MTEVITAGPADLEQLSHVIAEAFCDLPPSTWLIANPAARRQVFPAYFRMLLDHACASGTICTTPNLDAVAAWIPVAGRPPDPLPGYPARLRAATLPWTKRFVAFDAALARRHPASTPHHHLALLAVRPGRQGHGTGTALLNARHQALDAVGATAYLEASSQRNRALYLRHGYTDLGPPIHLPDGPHLWPMWREPLPATTGPPAAVPGQ